MSAFLVSDEHVDLLVGYAIATAGDCLSRVSWRSDETAGDWDAEWRTLEPFSLIPIDGYSRADEACRILRLANLRSVRARYDEGGYDVAAETHRYRDRGYVLTHAEAVRACDCLDYQCCETDDWMETEARRLLDAIREHAIEALVRECLAVKYGVVSPPWEWDADTLERERVRR